MFEYVWDGEWFLCVYDFFSVASVNYCSGSSFWSALIVLRNFQFSGFMQLVVNELVLPSRCVCVCLIRACFNSFYLF